MIIDEFTPTVATNKLLDGLQSALVALSDKDREIFLLRLHIAYPLIASILLDRMGALGGSTN
jgi:hypothetical protein